MKKLILLITIAVTVVGCATTEQLEKITKADVYKGMYAENHLRYSLCPLSTAVQPLKPKSFFIQH